MESVFRLGDSVALNVRGQPLGCLLWLVRHRLFNLFLKLLNLCRGFVSGGVMLLCRSFDIGLLGCLVLLLKRQSTPSLHVMSVA